MWRHHKKKKLKAHCIGNENVHKGAVFLIFKLPPSGKAGKTYLLNQLPSLEESLQIGNLPRSQRAQTAHGDDAEEQYSIVGRSC